MNVYSPKTVIIISVTSNQTELWLNTDPSQGLQWKQTNEQTAHVTDPEYFSINVVALMKTNLIITYHMRIKFLQQVFQKLLWREKRSFV